VNRQNAFCRCGRGGRSIGRGGGPSSLCLYFCLFSQPHFPTPGKYEAAGTQLIFICLGFCKTRTVFMSRWLNGLNNNRIFLLGLLRRSGLPSKFSWAASQAVNFNLLSNELRIVCFQNRRAKATGKVSIKECRGTNCLALSSPGDRRDVSCDPGRGASTASDADFAPKTHDGRDLTSRSRSQKLWPTLLGGKFGIRRHKKGQLMCPYA